jgi:hypothetical protein
MAVSSIRIKIISTGGCFCTLLPVVMKICYLSSRRSRHESGFRTWGPAGKDMGDEESKCPPASVDWTKSDLLKVME